MAGIDYGMGTTNIDHKTGIRYGVISANAVGQAWFDDAEADYGDPTCPDCGSGDVAESEHETDYECNNCGELFNADAAYGDDPIAHTYDGDGYAIQQGGDDPDLFVTASPYYTLARFCSPCAPGAGHLESPSTDGVRTYCLGHDWFEGGRAPYPVYRVADGSVVEPPAES